MTEKSQTKTKETKAQKYVYAVGKRKTSIAQVRLFEDGKGEITINDKPINQYFKEKSHVETLLTPLKLVNMDKLVNLTVKVRGGGTNSQSEAIRHAIARALNELNADFRKTLKVAGFLKRDARIKERKKPGLKRARRAPQWQKR